MALARVGVDEGDGESDGGCVFHGSMILVFMEEDMGVAPIRGCRDGRFQMTLSIGD
uniref:Uncharacterized protein n=1 Tax=Candidatus Kentrum sp. MB TaxID=2138164 RepID=A0A450XGB3_9GAMM|nr:MAG: hypothetical protein BECKMB1821G_GA0114241_103623 [Candidatus Kentron sp. MB]